MNHKCIFDEHEKCFECDKPKRTASETIKACGLKSTRQVAQLNGVSDRTVQLAYKDDYPKFQQYIFSAIDELYELQRSIAEDITGC